VSVENTLEDALSWGVRRFGGFRQVRTAVADWRAVKGGMSVLTMHFGVCADGRAIFLRDAWGV